MMLYLAHTDACHTFSEEVAKLSPVASSMPERRWEVKGRSRDRQRVKRLQSSGGGDLSSPQTGSLAPPPSSELTLSPQTQSRRDLPTLCLWSKVVEPSPEESTPSVVTTQPGTCEEGPSSLDTL